MLKFVNLHGDPVCTTGNAEKKAKRTTPSVFHKGFLVEGFPPGSIEDARLHHEKLRLAASKGGMKRIPGPWDEAAYIAKTKPKRLRSKPYEVHDAASVCAQIAERTGWQHVRVRPLSKGAP